MHALQSLHGRMSATDRMLVMATSLCCYAIVGCRATDPLEVKKSKSKFCEQLAVSKEEGGNKL